MSDRLFCFYGDDFTGSTDALEALAANGVPTVLFLDPPDESRLARFPRCRAIGIAGESRSRDPMWMSRELPDIFENLKQYKAPLCQYKVCSTFDSSPDFGSIGRAIEIGQQVFGCPYTPVVVGAPHLKRYLLFGNLFGAGGAEIHRIDRHPTMSHHPVTPMLESDLRVHLARQTNRTSGLVDILALHNGDAERRFEELRNGGKQVIFFDGLDSRSLQETGRILWTRSQVPYLFAVGSAGLTHAMIHHWRAAGLIEAEHRVEFAQPVDRLIVISGSCSPVTAEQVHWALNHGFEGIRITMSTLAETGSRDEALRRALSVLQHGRSIVLYTALGPQDCGGASAGMDLGTALGVLLSELLPRSGVRRVAFAGGDTSTHAVRRLGIDALTFAAPVSPGAPLCSAHSASASVDGLELVLKGGQVGAPDFFGAVLRGSP